jgi:hypothetical protein
MLPWPIMPPLGGNSSPNINIGPTIGGMTFGGLTLSQPPTNVGGIPISGVSIGGSGPGFSVNPVTGTAIPNGGGYNPITVLEGAGGTINGGGYVGIPGGNMQPAAGVNPNAQVNGNGPGSIGGTGGVTFINEAGESVFVGGDILGGGSNQSGIVGPAGAPGSGGGSGSGGGTVISVVDVNNHYGDLSNPCNGTPLRQFKLNAPLIENNGLPTPATGQYFDLLSQSWVDTSVVVGLNSRLWHGRAETGDYVAAVWDCVSQTFYALGTGASVLVVVELGDDAFQGNGSPVTCAVMQWSGTQWEDSGNTVEAYTDFFGGYGFEDELYTAFYSSEAEQWYLAGSGHYKTRGTLVGALASGGSATVDLARGGQVLFYEVYGLSSSIPLGTKVGASWSRDTDHWEVDVRGCV